MILLKQNALLVLDFIKFTTKISNVFLPFTKQVLANVLLKANFSPTSKKFFDFKEDSTETIAEKDSYLVHFNENSRLILVTSSQPNPDELLAVEIFKLVRDTIADFVGSNKLKFQFYEFDVAGIRPSKNNPLRIFAHENNSFKKINELNRIFGTNVSNFGLRLFPSHHIIDSTDWFEYSIQPFVFVPEDIYQVRAIHRNKNLDVINAALGEFRSNTDKIIKLLENE